jgi:hypothetical protein
VDQGDGTFQAQLESATATGTDTIRATVNAGGQAVQLATPATVVNFLCGDANEDGLHTSADIIWLVNYIFKGGPSPKPVPLAGDTNRNSLVTSADVIFLVGYVFKSGAPPCT